MSTEVMSGSLMTPRVIVDLHHDLGFRDDRDGEVGRGPASAGMPGVQMPTTNAPGVAIWSQLKRLPTSCAASSCVSSVPGWT